MTSEKLLHVVDMYISFIDKFVVNEIIWQVYKVRKKVLHVMV